jgi:molecular chaperone GrpE
MSDSESPAKSTEEPARAPAEGAADKAEPGRESRISQAPTSVGDTELELGAVSAGGAAATESAPASGKAPDRGGAPDSGKASDSSEAAATNGDGAAPEPEPDPLEQAKAEAKRLRDQLVRTAADFDNFRKRARRDQDDAQKRGRETLLKELLPIFDNLERAAGHADSVTDIKSVAAGLKMVLKQFEQTLDRVGIARVVTVGKPFDPGQHEAIQHLDSAEHEAGVVMTEVQSGYVADGKLVRAALVVVSKGPGPKPADDAGASDAAAEESAGSSDDAPAEDGAGSDDDGGGSEGGGSDGGATSD